MGSATTPWEMAPKVAVTTAMMPHFHIVNLVVQPTDVELALAATLS